MSRQFDTPLTTEGVAPPILILQLLSEAMAAEYGSKTAAEASKESNEERNRVGSSEMQFLRGHSRNDLQAVANINEKNRRL